MIDCLRSRRVRVGKMAWFNSFVLQFPWVFPLLLLIYLFLALRENAKSKQLTTQQVIQKYKNLAESRKPRSSRRSRDVHQKAIPVDRDSAAKQVQQVDKHQLAESLGRERELLSLIRDRKTCERLLKGLRRQYPDETRLWIVEKAISDVERDRR